MIKNSTLHRSNYTNINVYGTAKTLLIVLILIFSIFDQASGAKTNNNIALIKASSDGNLKLVKSLIKKGANVNAKNKKGNTPLHLAAVSGHLKIVEFLLLNGADSQVKDKDGWTAFKYANTMGYKKVETILLKSNRKSSKITPELLKVEISKLNSKISRVNVIKEGNKKYQITIFRNDQYDQNELDEKIITGKMRKSELINSNFLNDAGSFGSSVSESLTSSYSKIISKIQFIFLRTVLSNKDKTTTEFMVLNFSMKKFQKANWDRIGSWEWIKMAKDYKFTNVGKKIVLSSCTTTSGFHFAPKFCNAAKK